MACLENTTTTLGKCVRRGEMYSRDGEAATGQRWHDELGVVVLACSGTMAALSAMKRTKQSEVRRRGGRQPSGREAHYIDIYFI